MHSQHTVTVGAPRGMIPGNSAPKAPTILDRDDDDFITAVLEGYRTDTGRAGLAASVASQRAADNTLKLFQPIQRRYHLALLEAWCDTPGKPRLDPAKVGGAGMVLRRMGQDADGNPVLEGWMRAAGRLRGWVPVARLGPAESDPRPEVRRARRATGQPQIDHALVRLSAGTDPAVLDEHVVPMFAAPPDVCADAGRSLYYGVVQTSSSELAGTPPDTAAFFQDFGPDSQAFTDHLVQPLRGDAYAFPNPGLVFNTTPESYNSLLHSTDVEVQRFIILLRQVAIEFDAFGPGSEGQAVFAELQKIPLSYVLKTDETTPRTINAGDFLKKATRVLLEGDASIDAVEIPETWPALDADAAARLAGAMSLAMQTRFTAVKGHPGRFDAPDARYVLRAFLRLKPDGDCPGKTLWSEYSESFVIAPWYEGAGTPAQIPLPDVTDRALLKSLKPNVSFVLPPSLQCMLQGNPDDMMKGNFPSNCKTGVGIGWICSFSIPVITLCAFIVLNIFLSLFDLFFRWMLFIKVCIPFPKSKGS